MADFDQTEAKDDDVLELTADDAVTAGGEQDDDTDALDDDGESDFEPAEDGEDDGEDD